MILYIHGFNSSASSFKARSIQARLAELGRESEFHSPDLPHRPREAIALLENVIAGRKPCLIGSSLGGFYATWLAEKHALRAVLVNPAVRPHELLSGYVGRQKNLYTGGEYDFTLEHVEELRGFEVERITPERYFLLTCTGDEVLDYRAAVKKYAQAQQRVIEGGDHGFGDFAQHLEPVLRFCGPC
jgi:predicted esterase YcpF (UPF0227 family)